MKRTGTKSFYNSDGREASKWVREPLGKTKGEDAPQMTSGLTVVKGKPVSLQRHALGHMINDANQIMKSATCVSCTSSFGRNGHCASFSVLPANWYRAIALYAARKLVTETWINQKDEYLIPLGSLL